MVLSIIRAKMSSNVHATAIMVLYTTATERGKDRNANLCTREASPIHIPHPLPSNFLKSCFSHVGTTREPLTDWYMPRNWSHAIY